MTASNRDDNSQDTNQGPAVADDGVVNPVSPQTNDGRRSEGESWRQVVGRGMSAVSDFVNEHLIAVRYATVASIALLSAYGIASTPLFFRFKTVKDIPSSFFLKRRTIQGRLVRVVEDADPVLNGDVEEPIVCLVRHLSPVGRLLGRSAFEFVMRSHPAASVDTTSDEDKHELLKVEIAAVREPPLYIAPSYAEQPGEWLRRLADEKAPVSCQLLARRSRIEGAPMRDTAALAEFNKLGGEEQTAICHVSYRPGGHLFRSDLAKSLVRNGRASLLSGLFVSLDNWTILDTSDRVEDLKKDTKYVSRLEEAEYEAAKESVGMWADPVVRESRQDLVEEIAFQSESNVLQKLWRWLRG